VATACGGKGLTLLVTQHVATDAFDGSIWPQQNLCQEYTHRQISTDPDRHPHEDALRRLKGTVVETNIRANSTRRREMFGLLDDWSHDTDAITGHSKGIKITLPRWLYDGVATHRDVLAIAPAYFDLTSGIARWLYRLARRHAGKQAMGWRFTMKGLHERSGSTQPLNQFARDVRKVIAKGVPEYQLDIARGQLGDEIVSMVRDQAKIRPPQRRTLTRGFDALPADTMRSVDGHGVSPTKARCITHRKRP
jgi:plasmid replication initiation protein